MDTRVFSSGLCHSGHHSVLALLRHILFGSLGRARRGGSPEVLPTSAVGVGQHLRGASSLGACAIVTDPDVDVVVSSMAGKGCRHDRGLGGPVVEGACTHTSPHIPGGRTLLSNAHTHTHTHTTTTIHARALPSCLGGPKILRRDAECVRVTANQKRVDQAEGGGAGSRHWWTVAINMQVRQTSLPRTACCESA